MKGQREIQLNGDTLTIKFTFGAVEDFCEELGITFSDWQEEVFNSPKNMRMFIYHMAKDDADIEPEDLRELDFFDTMGKVSSFISEASEKMNEQLGNTPRGKQ